MTAPTLSGLSLVAACPGSASLPRQRRASGAASTLGTAIHELCAVQVEGGDGGDIPGLWADILPPDDAGRLAFLAEHLRLPVPPGALAEVPLGLFPDGRVERIEGGAGSYPDVGQVLSGTLDALWAEPEPFLCCADLGPDCNAPRPEVCARHRPSVLRGSTLWVVDWKTGDEDHVPPIARNWQLRAGALLAARWTGATRVIPAICFVNAAECAAELRAGREYTGRWEVGDLLDAAALDAIEVELRAVLGAARGEGDEVRLERGGEGCDPNDRDGGSGGSSAALALPVQEPGARVLRRSPPLILGPHCEHCPAREHCPEFGAAARQLVEQAQLSPRSPVLMTPADRAMLAAMIPAMRATLDRAEEALRAGGPVQLADGRVYAPHLETVTDYKTRETFDVLVPIIGELLANDAASYTATSIKAALEQAGAPRGAWPALRAQIDAAGGVVLTGREVWRRKWLAEVVKDGVRDADEDSDRRPGGGARDDRDASTSGGQGDPGGRDPRGAVGGALPDPGGAPPQGPRKDADVARAPCPDCGAPGIAVNRSGKLRAHQLAGTALRCRPGLRAPGKLSPPEALRAPIHEPAPVAQLSIEGA